MKKNSNRLTRICNEVQRELSEIIRFEVKDPRIGLMTSVTSVKVTADLKLCKAYISVLGTEEEKKNTMEALKSAGGFIRRQLASRLNLRNTPEVSFAADDSIEYGVRMSERIDQVIRKDESGHE